MADDHQRELLERFRTDYAEFLASPYTVENAPIQKDTTQVYRNILEFRKNRLSRLGLACSFESLRRTDKTAPSVKQNRSFDGKYEITEVTEPVIAKTAYIKDGKQIYSKKDKELARYVLLNAKETGPDTIICPGCGAPASREDLLDGCDSCGTKFIIEDLGTKINDHGFRTDYDLFYEKYRHFRKMMTIIVGAVLAIISLAFSFCWCGYSYDAAIEADAGPVGAVFATLFAILFVTASFTFLGMFFFFILIFPIIQLSASATHFSKKLMKKLKDANVDDTRIQKEVRKYDPNFSVYSFYSGIQNKLASVHFAETPQQINAFTTFDLSYMLNAYQNVVDIDTDYISLRYYNVDQASGLQVAGVEAYLTLSEYINGKIKRRDEKLQLTLTKSAACTTQAVCGPSIFKCKGCASSLTLLNGRLCPTCGADINLEAHDWVIRNYGFLAQA